MINLDTYEKNSNAFLQTLQNITGCNKKTALRIKKIFSVYRVVSTNFQGIVTVNNGSYMTEEHLLNLIKQKGLNLF